jgi:hypothetical protein
MSNIEKIKEELAMKHMAGTLKEEDFWDLPKDNKLRIFVCSLGPKEAYYYAYFVDNKIPNKETRNSVCKDPQFAYWYAMDVDQCPMEKTKIAVDKNSWWKECYQQFEVAYYAKHKKD